MNKELKLGLLGHNISYSRSADIFRAIFDMKNIEGTFEVYDLAPARFSQSFPELLKDGLNGLSVTIPYKNTVISHLDDIDPVARALDAVNSIYVSDGKLSGFNTDCYGFSIPLRKSSDKLKHGTALILGCGGAAKAAVYSLYTDYEIKAFIVVGRTMAKLRRFRESLRRQIRNINISILRLSTYNTTANERYDIVINCTPLGGCNHVGESPIPESFAWRRGKIYYDLNYNRDNRIIVEAQSRSMAAIDGSAMLVGQAIRSFHIWTGQTVEFDPVYQAVFGEMPQIPGDD